MSEMDLCEYTYYQQLIMRRLLSWLRESQTSCSDIQCFNDLPGETLPASATPENLMMMTMFCVVVGVFLFMTRPSSLRTSDSDGKPHSDRSGNPDPDSSSAQ